MLGYGNTDDGISKNVVTLLGQMADELEKEPDHYESDDAFDPCRNWKNCIC